MAVTWLLKKAFHHSIPYRREQTIILALWSIIILLGAVQPFLLRNLINSLYEKTDITLIILLITLILVLITMTNIANYFAELNLETLKRRASKDFWILLYKKIQELPYKETEEKTKGDFMAKILSDASFIAEIVGGIIPSYLINIGRFIAYAVVLLLLNWQLSLLIFGFIPVYYAIFRKYSKEISQSSREERAAYSETLQSLKEKLDGHVSVKKSLSSHFFLGLFSKDAETWFSKMREVLRNENKYVVAYGYFTSLIPLAILSLGAYMTFVGLLDLGTLIAYFTSCRLIFEPISNISSNLGYSSQAVAPAERFFALLEEYEVEKSGDKRMAPVKSVEFEDVFFRYNHENILRGVTFSFSKGVIGVVGWSGAGKSTITKLLVRFYSPEKGRILINGIPVEEYDTDDLRRKVVLVSQQEYIFDLSLEENIALGINFSEDKIKEILRTCASDELISSLKNGAGEMGKNLSDGEKQRLALARALIRSPEILILDEALSAVDSEREGKIMKNMREYLPNAIFLVISHRLSTIKEADTILVLKNGLVVAEGNHEYLLKSSSEYQNLIKNQLT